MCSPHTATYSDNNALSNSLPNDLFVDGFNNSPGWLLMSRTGGAWWCRYRGHCRSGPRHLSPRSRVCAQEWHSKDIHSHIHSHTPMHTPKKMQKQQQQNAQLTKNDAFLYWSSSCAVCWWPIFRKLGTCSTTDALSPRTLLTENMCESVHQILRHSPAEKKERKKPLNSPNMMPFFTGPLPVQSAGGRRPGSLADATQDCSTAEDFSPRTVLTKNICRSVHHILQHFPTTMPFLTVSAITYSWMASTALQADSWWLGHVEPDDVVIVDIASQALDIFLHGPESAHKNGIAKTFTHTSIPIHPCTLLKKCKKTTAKCSTHQTWCLSLLVVFLCSVLVADFQEAWHLLHDGRLVA